MSQDTTKEFGKWRSMLWPIHAYELKKLLPMFFMFFCISFNYTVLRDTKDTLIVTASGSGAEAIPFLKLWCVVPAAVLFMIIYSRMSNSLSREKLFYATVTPFVIWFGVFAAIIYPNIETLHPTTSADWLQATLPAGFKGMIAIYRNWSFAVFYVMAELWGSVALSLLFWGFANEITRVTEAKRFYSLFGIGANIALLCSGPFIVMVSNIRASLPADVDAWGVSLNYLMGAAVIMGVLVMVTYRWINQNVLTDPRFYEPTEVKTKKSKPKMGLGESFRYLASSKYILCLATLVLAYGVCINLVEVTWKGKLKELYPNPNDYSVFMGYFSTFTGAATIFMMLFVGGNVMRRFGWGVAAIVTPVVLAATGGLFFLFVLGESSSFVTGMVAFFGATPLYLAVIIGAVQNIMSKSAKYSLFDPTKEMAYIPLDQESKVKGKAAIDVVGARLGKSGGAAINMGLIVLFGNLAAITPFVAVIMFAIIGGWIIAARALNKQFVELTGEQVESGSAKPATAKIGDAKPAGTTA